MLNDYRLHTHQTDAEIVNEVAAYDEPTARRVASRLRALRLELALTKAAGAPAEASPVMAGPAGRPGLFWMLYRRLWRWDPETTARPAGYGDTTR